MPPGRFFSGSAWNAGIGGVENVWEFNGLQLNDRQVADRYLIKEIDVSQMDFRDSRAPLPASHGELPYNLLIGGRTITITGTAYAGNLSKLRDMLEDLRQAFWSSTELPLYCRRGSLGGTDTFINCRPSAAVAIRDAQRNQSYERDFQITLRASNPRFLSTTLKSTTIVAAGGGVNGTCTNAGNFPAEPTYTLGKATGSINTAVITNSTTGQAQTITGNNSFASASKFFKIENAAQLRTFKDDLNVDKWSLWSVLNSWATLAVGSNTINLNQTAFTGTVNLVVEWRDSWI